MKIRDNRFFLISFRARPMSQKWPWFLAITVSRCESLFCCSIAALPHTMGRLMPAASFARDCVGFCVGAISIRFFKNWTLSLNPYPLTSMTRSIELKFFSHRKHLARLVDGFTAVWNSLHTGHRKRKTPSLIFEGICNWSLISISTGILFLNSNNSRDENLFFMGHLILKFFRCLLLYHRQWPAVSCLLNR